MGDSIQNYRNMIRYSAQLFISIIVCIKIQTIYSSGSFYTSDQKNVYFIDNEEKYSWFDALTKCVNLNMNLVAIETKEKSDEINSLLSKEFKKVNPMWIGAAANGKYRHYVWISNGHTVSFTNWFRGEPNFSDQNEYCLQTGWAGTLQWNDNKCHLEYGLICEYNKERLQLQQQLEKNKADLQKELNNEKQLEEELVSIRDKLKDELTKEENLQNELDKKNELISKINEFLNNN